MFYLCFRDLCTPLCSIERSRLQGRLLMLRAGQQDKSLGMYKILDKHSEIVVVIRYLHGFLFIWVLPGRVTPLPNCPKPPGAQLSDRNCLYSILGRGRGKHLWYIIVSVLLRVWRFFLCFAKESNNFQKKNNVCSQLSSFTCILSFCFRFYQHGITMSLVPDKFSSYLRIFTVQEQNSQKLSRHWSTCTSAVSGSSFVAGFNSTE